MDLYAEITNRKLDDMARRLETQSPEPPDPLAIRHCRVAFLCRYAKGAQHDPN